jgi:hypothetical protein
MVQNILGVQTKEMDYRERQQMQTQWINWQGDNQPSLYTTSILRNVTGGLHENTNDNVTGVVNSTTATNLRVKSTVLPHQNICKYTCTSPDDKRPVTLITQWWKLIWGTTTTTTTPLSLSHSHTHTQKTDFFQVYWTYDLSDQLTVILTTISRSSSLVWYEHTRSQEATLLQMVIGWHKLMMISWRTWN